MLSPTDMAAMFTTQRSCPVKFSVNLRRRRIEVSFHHEFKAPPEEDTAYRSLFAAWQKRKKRAAKEQEALELAMEEEGDEKVTEGSGGEEQEELDEKVKEGSSEVEQGESDWDEPEESDDEEQEKAGLEEEKAAHQYEEDELSDTEYELIEEWERRETYRFEIRFEPLGTLLEEPSEDVNTRTFSISLPFPPEFYRKLHNTHKSFTDPNARRWTEWDSWFRQTIMTYQPQCVDNLPITLRQPYAVIDLGTFTSLPPVTAPTALIIFVRSMDYLPVCV